MNPSPSSPLLLFSTNENKALLWSVLHGSGKFIGIPDSEIHIVNQIFEKTIYEISEHYRTSNQQAVNLNAMNKEAVVIICKKIENVKRPQHQIYQKKKMSLNLKQFTKQKI